MTDIDDLDRSIDGLQKLQRISWQQLADRSVTAEQNRAARTQLKQTNIDLRTLLQKRSQRACFGNRKVVEVETRPVIVEPAA